MKTIPLDKGIYRSPSAGADGQLDVCVNLMPKDGEMRNTPRLRQTGWQLPSGARLLAVHRLEGDTNLIYAVHNEGLKISINVDDRTWSFPTQSGYQPQEGENIVVTLRGTYTETVVGPGGENKEQIFTFETFTKITYEGGRSGNLQVPVLKQGTDITVTDIFVDSDKTRMSVPVSVTYTGDSTGRPRRIRGRIDRDADLKYNRLCYKDDDGETHVIADLGDSVTSVQVMGNTLIVTSDRIYYAVWKDGAYVWLGSEFPEVDIQFRLKGEYVTTYEQKAVMLDYDPNSTGNRKKVFDEVVCVDNKTQRYDSLTAATTPTVTAGQTYKITFHRNNNFSNLDGVVVRGRTQDKGQGETDSQDFEAAEPIGQTKKTGHRVHELVFTAKQNYHHLVFYAYGYGGGTQYIATLLKGNDSADVSFKNREGDLGETGYNAIIGIANRFVNDYHRDKNKFIYPFLVRYALRLYDGSFVNISAPALMVPNDGLVPVINSLSDLDAKDPEPDVYCSAVVADLEYFIGNADSLEKWKDIITDVVIGVTPQAYSYNQGDKFDPTDIGVKIHISKDGDINIVDLANAGSSYCVMDGVSGQWEHTSLFDRTFASREGFTYELPSFDDAHIKKEICERGDFHIIKYLKAGDIQEMNDFATLELEDGTLTGLEARRVIDESTRNPRSITAGALKVYNQRLVLGDVTEVPDNGARPVAMSSHIGTYVNGTQSSEVIYHAAVTDTSRNGTAHTTVRMERDTTPLSPDFLWAFYPDPEATEMTIYGNFGTTESPEWRQAELPLERHNSLHGSFFFNNFDGVNWIDCQNAFDPATVFTSDSCYEVRESGKIIQSGAANPFVFPTDLKSYVTRGDVMAMATATLALSEGQFGQFPLYAFCTDGVWALNFDAAGKLTSSQPASLEKANNIRGICETEQTVYFTTDRGLRMLAGSSVREVAAHMHGPVRTSQYMNNLEDLYIEEYEEWTDMLVTDQRQWTDILKTCRMSYDYPNSLLHIYPSPTPLVGAPPTDWHYVMQTDNEQVCMSKQTPPADIVRDLTTDLVTCTADGVLQVCDYQDNRDDTNPSIGFLLTRPTALGDPISMKQVDDIRLLCHLLYGGEDTAVAVLVSNDRATWWRLPSLRHRSFKWFRFAVFTGMNDACRLNGIVVQETPRRSNKIR